jgi:hypothetical protein
MTTALIRYADRWAVDDPIDDYVIMRHDIAMYALMREGEPMKMRRVLVEVILPEQCGDAHAYNMIKRGVETSDVVIDTYAIHIFCSYVTEMTEREVSMYDKV